MDRQAEAAIETACGATTLRFFHHLDSRNDAACVAQFEPNGAWERQGTWLRGRAAVTAALAERSAERRTCHLVTNLVTTVVDEQTARVDFCLVAYTGPEAEGANVPSGRLAGIRRCVDEMVLTGEGWRIARKSSEPVFVGA